jgi:SpoVK/Ycf46/Vps4 family AAA+-type ATPase
VVNTAQLISKWMGEAEKNIQAVFEDAEKSNAVLLFDEAEGLFGSRTSSELSNRTYTMCTGLLLQHIENHAGICIVVTNMKEMIDEAFLRRFRFVLHFEIPNNGQREHIWKAMIPEECPLALDVSVRDLAKYELAGGDIKNALLHAATRAALRGDNEDNKLTMDDLVFACDAELAKKNEQKQSERSGSMYS